MISKVLSSFLVAAVSAAALAVPAHASPTTSPAGATVGASSYPGCEERSTLDASWSSTDFSSPLLPTTMWLVECDTDTLITNVKAGVLGSSACALASKGIGKLPIPQAKFALAGELFCGAAAIALGAAVWKLESANKAKCGIRLKIDTRVVLVGQSWYLAAQGIEAEGLPCPDKIKDDEGDNTGPATGFDDADSGTPLGGQHDVSLLEGKWNGGEFGITNAGHIYQHSNLGSCTRLRGKFSSTGTVYTFNCDGTRRGDDRPWYFSADLRQVSTAEFGLLTRV